MIGGERAAADAACVFVVEFFDGRRFESHSIGSTQVEVADFVECRDFGAEVQSGFLVLRAAHAGGQYKAVRGSPFFLCVGGERIDGSDVVCYVVGRFQTVVLVLYTGIEDVSILLLTFSPAISSEVSSAFFEDDIAGDIEDDITSSSMLLTNE